MVGRAKSGYYENCLRKIRSSETIPLVRCGAFLQDPCASRLRDLAACFIEQKHSKNAPHLTKGIVSVRSDGCVASYGMNKEQQTEIKQNK